MPLFAVAQHSNFITKVIDYKPAPGQFTNTESYSAYKIDDDEQAVIANANTHLVGNQTKLLSLGAWGGYIVVGFDHSITNVEGEYDFRVYGNAFKGNSEPGIVMVMDDSNANGIADDTWYELAGSDYYLPTTKHNYSVTYYRPENESDNVLWTDSEGNSGNVTHNNFHKQIYYPEWLESDTYTLTGTCMVMSGSGSLTAAEGSFGYADSWPNADDGSKMKIDWAVDENGNSVKLHKIDFVKVYTGVQRVAGIFGETSTEFADVEDLHIEQSLAVSEVVANNSIVYNALTKTLCSQSDVDIQFAVYNIFGQKIMSGILAAQSAVDLSSLPKGVYIAKSTDKTLKINL